MPWGAEGSPEGQQRGRRSGSPLPAARCPSRSGRALPAVKRASAVSPSRRHLVQAPAACLTPKPSLLHRLGAGSRGDTSRHVSEQSRAWGLVQTAGSVVFRLGVLGEATSPAEPPSCLRTRTTPALTPQGNREPRTISHAPSAYNKQHPGPRERYLSGGRSGPPCLCSPLRRVPTRSAAAEASGGQHRDTAGPQ